MKVELNKILLNFRIRENVLLVLECKRDFEGMGSEVKGNGGVSLESFRFRNSLNYSFIGKFC